MGGRHLVSRTKLFFHVPEMYNIYPFFFLTEANGQHKGRLFTVVTFRLFLLMRLVSNSRNDYN